MVDFLPGLTAPVASESRPALQRQTQSPAAQLALQQPALVTPVTAQVAAPSNPARDVRERAGGKQQRRRPPSREGGRGGLIDREL